MSREVRVRVYTKACKQTKRVLMGSTYIFHAQAQYLFALDFPSLLTLRFGICIVAEGQEIIGPPHELR